MKTVSEIMSLKGRRALITGAAGHLGKVISANLAELGAALLLVDRDEKKLEETAINLRSGHLVEITTICTDLEKEDQRDELVRQILDSFSNLNVLVNNAAFVGTSILNGWAVPFEDQSIDTWRRAFEVNLTAPFHLTQKLAPVMKASEGASIVNISSIYGILGPDWKLYEGTKMANPAAYAASKGGLIQLTRWLATTLAPMIRVNCISPGGISRNQPDLFVKRYENKVPLGRMAVESDIAKALCFLATDLSSYITGSNLVVDGGLSSI